MLSTVLIATYLLALWVVSVVLWAIFLRLGVRWAKIEGVTTRRLALATVLVFALQLVLNIIFRLPFVSKEVNAILIIAAEIAAAVFLPCSVIVLIFKTRFLLSLKAWLPTLFPSIAIVLFIVFLQHPYLYEGFVVSTNSMAPTLIGSNSRSVCPECGQPNYGSSMNVLYPTQDTLLMICDSFHVSKNRNIDKQTLSADRFLVSKFFTPRRWDIVLFQYPQEPSALFVMRLVGLPGEKIHIENGAVWANGQKLTPPDPLRGIEYLPQIPGQYSKTWGSVKHPATLNENEYFVLGDFSALANDSRLWKQGASGHNPFAVPKSHLRGVVTHIYWPFQRWRILR